MDLDLPVPHSAPLQYVSPTLANDLLTCAYRVAWRLDPSFRHLGRPRPSTKLGVVAHAVAEEIARGLLRDAANADDAERLAEAAWHRHLEREVKDLQDAWAPAVPPPPTEWSGYHLIHRRTIRKAVRNFNRGAHQPAGLPSPRNRSPRAATFEAEVDLSDEEHGLVGRADRLEGAPGDRCVVDLKTGLEQGRPTASQRRQLLLYAQMLEATEGALPTRMAIEDPSGRRWEEPVSRDEVAHAVAEVQQARRRYEAASSPRELAEPSADTCRWCDYRVTCAPYWAALDSAWEHPSVAGHVAGTRVAAARSILYIDAQSPVDTAGRTWTVSAAPASLAEAHGTIAITGAEHTGYSLQLRWRWSTVTWPVIT